MGSLYDQTLALAGLLQSTRLVDQIARLGRFNTDEMATCLESVFITSPGHTLEVYGDLANLKTGLELLTQLFGKQAQSQNEYWLRYALSLLHLETRLKKSPSMLAEIGKGIEVANSARQHFGLEHENTINALADTYQKTLSTFSLRIQVSGEAAHLQSPLNAARIRALLLSGIRSALLWRQVGGKRWHLLIKRGQIYKQASALLDKIDSTI